MKYVLSGKVIHVLKENDNKATLCGKFIWSFETIYHHNDFPELLCKRCKSKVELINPLSKDGDK